MSEINATAGIRKQKRQWQAPRNGKNTNHRPASGVRPGAIGMWVTCYKSKERKCIGELGDLLSEHIGDDAASPVKETFDDHLDIESDLSREIESIQKAKKSRPYEAIWTDVPCVLFFKLSPSLDPLAIVIQLAEKIESNPKLRRTRAVQRLTPAPATAYASTDGLENVAKQILGPHFLAEDAPVTKYAIRTTIRQHVVLKREQIIKLVANIVGERHKVDLKCYDKLILVDVLKNVVSMCVVGKEYERLRRFNLDELYEIPGSLQNNEEDKKEIQMNMEELNNN